MVTFWKFNGVVQGVLECIVALGTTWEWGANTILQRRDHSPTVGVANDGNLCTQNRGDETNHEERVPNT